MPGSKINIKSVAATFYRVKTSIETLRRNADIIGCNDQLYRYIDFDSIALRRLMRKLLSLNAISH